MSGDEPVAVPPGVAAEEFRRALGRHAAGVVVVTTSAADGRPVGFTATSFTSVSADPPLVSFNIALTASSWPAVRQADGFVAHVLGSDQDHLGRRFSGPAEERFGPSTRWRAGPDGLPLLEEVLAWVACAMEARYPAGDHMIVVGRVLEVGLGDGEHPLVYHSGCYRRLSPGP